MELIKLILFILTGLIDFAFGKVDLYSQTVLTGRSSSRITQNEVVKEVIETQNIDIFKDKVLTQKLISFDGVAYSLHMGPGNQPDGVLFDPSKSNNAGIANNYLSDKGTKEGEGVLIRFTNFFKCEVFSVPLPDLHTDVVQMGIVDPKGDVTYMALSFAPTDKHDKKKLSEDIGKNCKINIDSLKKKLDEFYKEVQAYWKAKGQIQSLGDQVSKQETNHKVENDALAQVLNDKKNFENNLNETTASLAKSKQEMDAVQKKLKDEYKLLNDLKAKKAASEKNLTAMNSTLGQVDNDTKVVQVRLDRLNKESDQMRIRSGEIIRMIVKVKDQMYAIEKNLTDEKDVQHVIENKMDETNKKVNENGKNLAKFNKDIKLNKDFLDKLALEDLPNTINKTKSLVSEFQKASVKTMDETKKTDGKLAGANQTIQKTMKNLVNLISKPDVLNAAKTGKVKKNMQDGKESFESLRKAFPILPDIFLNNLWNFMSLNHYEAMNYIQAIKPSYFGMYDHIFSSNDPARLLEVAKENALINPEPAFKLAPMRGAEPAKPSVVQKALDPNKAVDPMKAAAKAANPDPAEVKKDPMKAIENALKAGSQLEKDPMKAAQNALEIAMANANDPSKAAQKDPKKALDALKDPMKVVQDAIKKADPTKKDPAKDPMKKDPAKDPMKKDPAKDPMKKDPMKKDPMKKDPAKDPMKKDPAKLPPPPAADPMKKDPAKLPPPPAADPMKKDPAKLPPPPAADPMKKDPAKLPPPPAADPMKKDPAKLPPPPAADPMKKDPAKLPPPPAADPMKKDPAKLPPPPAPLAPPAADPNKKVDPTKLPPPPAPLAPLAPPAADPNKKVDPTKLPPPPAPLAPPAADPNKKIDPTKLPPPPAPLAPLAPPAPPAPLAPLAPLAPPAPIARPAADPNKKLDPTKVDPAKFNSTIVDPAKVNSTNVDPTKVNSTNIDPAKVNSTNVDPTKDAATKSGIFQKIKNAASAAATAATTAINAAADAAKVFNTNK